MIVSKKRFLNVVCAYPDYAGPQIKDVLNKFEDWIQYTAGSWIVFTDIDPQTCATMLREIPGMQIANIFVSEITSYAGYLPDWCWQWLADRTAPGISKPI